MGESVESTADQRLRPSRESLEHMKYLRDMLSEIRQKVPQVRGLTFFGSRSRGQERQDPNHPSDLDTVVFYDGSEFTDNLEFEIFDTAGNLVPDFIQKNEKRRKDSLRQKQLRRQLKEEISLLMKTRGLPVDIYIEAGKNIPFNGTVFVEDISKHTTDRALKSFQLYIDTNRANQQVPQGVIDSPAFSITSRFLLGVGEELYGNRGYILDQFEEMEHQDGKGQKYFLGLMNCLRELQTDDANTGKRLPQSIQEARAFFKTT